MNSKKTWVNLLGVGLIAMTLISCDPASDLNNLPSSTLPSPAEESEIDPSPPLDPVTPEDSEPVVQQPLKANGTTVEIYMADSQCQELVPTEISVPEDKPMEAAVGEIIEKNASVDFEIASYRVNVNGGTGVATVDMRLAPDSKRQFVSLSSCEQFALFGSLNKTLTENPDWNIQEVKFTEQGEEILL